MTVSAAQRIHFVGIGGAGMSGLATVLLQRGRQVSGSDMKASATTAALQTAGVKFFLGHAASNLDAADLVVSSAAIPENNVELIAARERGIDVLTRGAALAEILAGSPSVVVAGTHGKTTTTAMIVAIVRAAGTDASYLVGAGDPGNNAHSGGDSLTIAESDESDGSFLMLTPTVAVITNVDVDHVDHWSSQDLYRAAFNDFVGRVEPGGSLVAPTAEGELLAQAAAAGRTTISFGADGDVRAADVVTGGHESHLNVVLPDAQLSVTLKVPGLHNVENALAAAAAAAALGIEPAAIQRGLEAYRGVERRFQIRGTINGRVVVDDYAHHPVEVRAVLAAARGGDGAWKRVVAVFQPHRFSRTVAFASDFGAAFSNADRVVITDIYGAGEPSLPGINGKLIADAVCSQLPGRPVAYIPDRVQLLAYLAATTRPGDLVLTLGAGDVTSVADELREVLDPS